MDIISRKEAQKQGLTKYFSGKSCVNGHNSQRWVSSRSCCECTATRASDWRTNNVEHRRSYRRKYRKDNIEAENAYNKKWRDAHRDELNTKKRLSYRSNLINYMIYRARDRANKKNLPFDLLPQDIQLPKTCPVFGIEFIIGDKNAAPSLDRIIPEKGYVKGNVVVVSMKANRIKNDATIEELKEVLTYYSTILIE